MSRTLRKLPFSAHRFDYRKPRVYPWIQHPHEVLRNPPEAVPLQNQYVVKSRVEVRHRSEKSQKGIPQAYLHHDWDDDTYEWRKSHSWEEVVSWKERVYDFSDELYDYKHYLYLHGLKYRNGTSFRQRINAVRLAKKSHNRAIRRNARQHIEEYDEHVPYIGGSNRIRIRYM